MEPVIIYICDHHLRIKSKYINMTGWLTELLLTDYNPETKGGNAPL